MAFGGLLGPNHAFRCSLCAINFPRAGNCAVCGQNLSLMMGQKPDSDCEEKVKQLEAAAMLIDQERLDDRLDENSRVVTWRAGELQDAGFPSMQALALAKEREIDLHKACELVRAAGAELALEILL